MMTRLKYHAVLCEILKLSATAPIDPLSWRHDRAEYLGIHYPTYMSECQKTNIDYVSEHTRLLLP